MTSILAGKMSRIFCGTFAAAVLALGAMASATEGVIDAEEATTDEPEALIHCLVKVRPGR